jgi:hypothetical protein
MQGQLRSYDRSFAGGPAASPAFVPAFEQDQLPHQRLSFFQKLFVHNTLTART